MEQLIFQTTTSHSLDNNSECHLGRYQRDGELGPSGDCELRPDQTLDSHDVNIHHLLHIPENASGGSSDQHLLCCGRGAALHLWETLQVGRDKIHSGASGSSRLGLDFFFETFSCNLSAMQQGCSDIISTVL